MQELMHMLLDAEVSPLVITAYFVSPDCITNN